jgi:hypothetical protein
MVSGLEMVLILFTVSTKCILFLNSSCDESTRIAKRLARGSDHNTWLI